MSVKRHSFVIAAAAAMTMGLSAPAFAGGDDQDVNSGLVNVNDNNVPVQVCNNKVPVNALGVQVPVSDLNGALGLTGLLGSGVSKTTAIQDNSCEQGGNQANE